MSKPRQAEIKIRRGGGRAFMISITIYPSELQKGQIQLFTEFANLFAKECGSRSNGQLSVEPDHEAKLILETPNKHTTWFESGMLYHSPNPPFD